jgi:hypothetical protein
VIGDIDVNIVLRILSSTATWRRSRAGQAYEATRGQPQWGGEQQMLADPKMVVLDEASLGLAPLVVDRIFETPHQIAAAGVRACPATPHGSRRDLLRT